MRRERERELLRLVYDVTEGEGEPNSCQMTRVRGGGGGGGGEEEKQEEAKKVYESAKVCLTPL